MEDIKGAAVDVVSYSVPIVMRKVLDSTQQGR